MSQFDQPLPTNVLDAIRAGNTLEAIKRLRQSRGIGLAEAKGLVEAHMRNDPRVASTAKSLSGTLPADVIDAIQQGRVIEAVRLLHARGGVGLKEAKKAIEDQKARLPDTPRPEGPPPDTFNLAINALWWILAVLLAGFLAYYLLK